MAADDTSKFNVTTKIQHYCEFEWCIDEFSSMHKNLISPKFSTADDCSVKWTIILELANSHMTNQMKMKFEISDKSKQNLQVLFGYQLLFSAANNIVEQNSKSDISRYINTNDGITISRHQLNKYLHGTFRTRSNSHNKPYNYDQINFHGNLTITNCCKKNPEKVEITNKYLPQLQIDFKALLKNQEFTDVALNVGNEVIRAHKFVLCARSPVFRRMFEQNFKETVLNSVDIKDMEKSVLENFLAFLYSGVVEDRKFKTVTALYSAADKYEVKTLQDACREILISCISENTVAVILKLADMHNDDNLKEIAILYICDNFPRVELTTNWNHLLDTDPRLSSYTLRRVSTNISKFPDI